MMKDLADHGAQFLCSDRLSHLEDPSDGFIGSNHLNTHALLSLLAHQLTGCDGMRQFQYPATKRSPKRKAYLDQRYLEAERFAESIARDPCQMKISQIAMNERSSCTDWTMDWAPCGRTWS